MVSISFAVQRVSDPAANRETQVAALSHGRFHSLVVRGQQKVSAVAR